MIYNQPQMIIRSLQSGISHADRQQFGLNGFRAPQYDEAARKMRMI